MTELNIELKDKIWDIRHIMYDIWGRYPKNDYLSFLYDLEEVINFEKFVETLKNKKEVKNK